MRRRLAWGCTPRNFAPTLQTARGIYYAWSQCLHTCMQHVHILPNQYAYTCSIQGIQLAMMQGITSNKGQTMKYILTIALLMQGFGASAQICTKYCNPEKSKPCGNACIPKDNQCRKDWTTACVGIRPATAKQSYATPKHVNKAPTK